MKRNIKKKQIYVVLISTSETHSEVIWFALLQLNSFHFIHKTKYTTKHNNNNNDENDKNSHQYINTEHQKDTSSQA